MTFSQKYNELLLSHSAKIDENLYRIKLDTAIVSLREKSEGYCGVVMNFLEEYAEAMLDEINNLSDEIESNEEQYDREIRSADDEIERLDDLANEYVDYCHKLEKNIDELEEKVCDKEAEIVRLQECIDKLEVKLIEKDKETQQYIDEEVSQIEEKNRYRNNS